MSGSNLYSFVLALALSAGLVPVFAEPGPNVAVELQPDSPVLIVSTNVGPYARTQSVGTGAEIHARLSLRNVSAKTIAGLAFRIQYSGGGSDGQDSLVLPSVEAVPGTVFAVRVDLQTPSYAVRNQAPGVRIVLDAVLFRDYSLYGPDALHSRHSLTLYECEARREEGYLSHLLTAGRLSEIREELNFGLPEEQPQLGMELLPFQVPETQGKPLSVTPVVFYQAPVQALGGGALLTETALIGPHVLLKNKSTKRIRAVEIGFILRDELGHETRISTLPAQIALEPAQTRVVQQRVTILLTRMKGQPILLRSLAAFVAYAEFDDGSMWIPSREDIDRATDSVVLRRALADCPEIERMSGIFRRAGISGVESELKAAR